MDIPLVDSPLGILTILSAVCAFFFMLERKTGWKLFNFVPPLLFIYTVPLVFSNVGLMALTSRRVKKRSATVRRCTTREPAVAGGKRVHSDNSVEAERNCAGILRRLCGP